MAVTTITSNNKLIQFTREINREFVRQSMFSPYMGTGLDSIIRIKNELKQGGEVMNIPLVTKLNGDGKSTGVLAGSEESIDNYGMRLWIDWLRHAVATTKSETQKDSADIFGEAKPLLADWGKEKQRDELIAALMAFPSESAPTNLGTAAGQRVNGKLFESAFPTFTSTTAFNTFLADNVDRLLFGNALSNHYSSTAIASATSALSVIGSVKLTATTVQMMKRRAELCSPKIRPYKTSDGYEYYVIFAGSYAFRDAKNDSTIATANRDARPRNVGDNPIFQDGDLIYDGVIIRKVPEISTFTSNTWTALAAAASGRVEPVFLCGQQAATMAWGQMAKPTFRKEDDYGFINGTGIEMAYGVGKNFKKHPMYIPGTTTLNSAATGNTSGGGLSSLVQWGMVTGFFYAAVDA
jgi:hypothetical protein